MAGTLLQRAVVLDSATPFNFQAAFGLSDQLVCVFLSAALMGPGQIRGLRRRRIHHGRHPCPVFPQAQAISDHYPVEVTLKKA